jgi:hypothetical protein
LFVQWHITEVVTHPQDALHALKLALLYHMTHCSDFQLGSSCFAKPAEIVTCLGVQVCLGIRDSFTSQVRMAQKIDKRNCMDGEMRIINAIQPM